MTDATFGNSGSLALHTAFYRNYCLNTHAIAKDARGIDRDHVLDGRNTDENGIWMGLASASLIERSQKFCSLPSTENKTDKSNLYFPRVIVPRWMRIASCLHFVFPSLNQWWTSSGSLISFRFGPNLASRSRLVYRLSPHMFHSAFASLCI